MMFEKLTKKNAQAFFDAYIQHKDEALASLITEAEAAGITLDYSPESLSPLWQWTSPKYQYADRHPPQDKMPIWYVPEYVNEPHFSGPPLTIESAKIIDWLAYYFGEVLIRNLKGLKWVVGDSKNSAYPYKPAVEGSLSTYPLRVIGNNLARIEINGENPDALNKLYNFLKEELMSTLKEDI